MIPGEAMSSRQSSSAGPRRRRVHWEDATSSHPRSTGAATILAQTPSSPLVERVGDTGFLQLQAESFNALDARQQALAIG
jgi:hypothetical protein